jgi:hypothetical protein
MKPMTMAVLLAALYLCLQRNGRTSEVCSGMLGSETHEVLNKIDRSISENSAFKYISQNRKHLSYLNINQINLNIVMSAPSPGNNEPMEVDTSILNNSDRISTKAVERTFDITAQLPEDQVTLATTPYKGPLGKGFEYLQEDLTYVTLLVIRICSSTQNPSEAQLKQWPAEGLSSSLWLEVLTGVANNSDAMTAIPDQDVLRLKLFMSRLAYTPPNALFPVSRSSTDPTNASRAWSAAHLAIGSWHARVNKLARKEAQKQAQAAARNKVQTTLVADKNSQMSISAAKTAPLVSPEPKQAHKGKSNTKGVAFAPAASAAKRPAQDTSSQNPPKKQIVTKTKKVAKDYLQGELGESRISYKFFIPEKEDCPSDALALNLIGDLLQAYQAQKDPKAAILPWKKSDYDTAHPITDHAVVRTMEVSKFRTMYTDRFRPKAKQNCWFRLAIAHTVPRQHLLSGNLSNLASWFDDNDCGAWACTVQGSDDTVPVGELLYLGPFVDVVRINKQIQQACCKVVKNKELKFGCRTSKNPEVVLEDNRPRNWMLAENQMVLIEADRNDAKKLKQVLYATFNKTKDFRRRPGQYNSRYMPDKAQVVSGTKSIKTRANTLRKHAAVIQSLTIIKSNDIKHLDQVTMINGREYTLRSILHDLTFPLNSSDTEKTKPLFHTVDYPTITEGRFV